MLGDTVPIGAAVRQWGNVGALVAGLFRNDLSLIGRALEDHIAEPKRAALVPGLAQIKTAAMSAGCARMQLVRCGAVDLCLVSKS